MFNSTHSHTIELQTNLPTIGSAVLFLLQNRFLALVLPNLDWPGYNLANAYCCMAYTCGLT